MTRNQHKHAKKSSHPHSEQQREREAIVENFGIHPGAVSPVIRWILIGLIIAVTVAGALSFALIA